MSLATPAPTAGQYAALRVGNVNTNTLINDNTGVYTIPGINWNLDWDAKTKDVSNFRDGRARWGTLPDYTLTVTLVWDSANNPMLNTTSSLTVGQEVNGVLYTDKSQTTNKAWTGAFVVSKLGPKNEGVEGVLMMDATLEANGTLTPPSS